MPNKVKFYFYMKTCHDLNIHHWNLVIQSVEIQKKTSGKLIESKRKVKEKLVLLIKRDPLPSALREIMNEAAKFLCRNQVESHKGC